MKSVNSETNKILTINHENLDILAKYLHVYISGLMSENIHVIQFELLLMKI